MRGVLGELAIKFVASNLVAQSFALVRVTFACVINTSRQSLATCQRQGLAVTVTLCPWARYIALFWGATRSGTESDDVDWYL